MTATPFLERRAASASARNHGRAGWPERCGAMGFSLRCANGAGAAASGEQISRMDERMLKDIGITRAEALRLSSKPFWRE